MKIKFNLIMSIAWSIVAVIAGMYAVMNGGAMGANDEMSDPSIQYILAAFGIPGLLSIVFAFCNSIEDVVKIKTLIKKD